jgi:tetratricopeptide (TPR) repeat protein
MTALELLRTGTGRLKAGDAAGAERELRAALALDPKSAGAWVNLGGILLSRWEFRAAIEANRCAAEADPALAVAHFNQAVGHLHLGEASEALRCLNRTIELDPRNGAAWYHLGIVLRALHQPLEARLCTAYAGELGYRPPRASVEALESASPSIQGERHGAADGR